MKYRETLYAEYHRTQSGRFAKYNEELQFNLEKKIFTREIIPLLSDAAKDAQIFDVGCGTGSLLGALQANGFSEAQGMDISEDQLSVARRLGVHNVQAGDALTVLSQQRQLWDVVLMIDVLEHFTKDEFVNILHNVKTALKPGGKFVARIPNMDSYAGSTLANGDFTHETLLNASSAMQVFLACGFMNVMVHPSTLQTESALKEFIRKLLWPILKFRLKVELFANGLSTKNALFTPNMIIVAQA